MPDPIRTEDRDDRDGVDLAVAELELLKYELEVGEAEKPEAIGRDGNVLDTKLGHDKRTLEIRPRPRNSTAATQSNP